MAETPDGAVTERSRENRFRFWNTVALVLIPVFLLFNVFEYSCDEIRKLSPLYIRRMCELKQTCLSFARVSNDCSLEAAAPACISEKLGAKYYREATLYCAGDGSIKRDGRFVPDWLDCQVASMAR
jgi:hypothetical protein